MASIITDYGQDYLANVLFGKAQLVPASFWVALATQTPDASSDGTMLSEPAGSGYGRVNITNNATNWGPSSGGIVVNNVAVTFGIATADWPDPVTDYAFCDASAAGNVYLTGTLRLPRVVQQGDLVQFNPGMLAISVNGITQTIVGT